jgi:riboflavin synthase
MFTGLIEDVGRVLRVRVDKRSAVLEVTTARIRTLRLGASIAVNGACLTIAKKTGRSILFDVSPETLDRTSLGDLRPGSLVNLEQSLRLQDRVGGHLVTGHVDGVGVLDSIQTKGEFTIIEFTIPLRLEPFLVEKGSVAVDGISLTVNTCAKQRFSVAIIPFTLQHTNLRARGVGDKVNVETDLIGKYVHRFLTLRRSQT